MRKVIFKDTGVYGDTLNASNLDEKKVKVAIVNKARSWYLNQL